MSLFRVHYFFCLGSLLTLPVGCSDGSSASTQKEPHVDVGSVSQALAAVNLEGTSNIDWFECADEGSESICHSSIGKLLAYGANGQYKFKTADSESTPCQNDSFGGDPIGSIKKKCYFSSYTKISDEDPSVSVWRYWKGADAFGANGNFVFAAPSSDFYRCTRDTFGGDAMDPARNVRKACYRALADYAWAAEETTPPSTIELGPTPRPVAYGSNGKFRFALKSGSFSCGSDAFGGDPIKDVKKTCYTLPGRWFYNTTEGTDLVVPSRFTRCEYLYVASETGAVGQSLLGIDRGAGVLGGGGAGSAPLQGDFDLRTPPKCSTATFGGDPSPGVAKHCFSTCR